METASYDAQPPAQPGEQLDAQDALRERAVERALIAVVVVTSFAFLAMLVWGPTWRSGDPSVSVAVGALLGAGALGGMALVASLHTVRWAAPALLGVAAAFLATAGVLYLSGSPFPPGGYVGDSAFRIAEVTRFSEQLGFPDFVYSDLSAFNPPLVPWLEGRVADGFGLSSYETVKLFTILGAAVAVVAGGLMWMSVTDRTTAVLLGLAPLVEANWYNPSAWVALAVFVPWWFWVLQICGRDRPSARWAPVGAGIVGGLLVMTHQYFFLFVPVHLLVLAVARLQPWSAELRQRVTLPRPVVLGVVAAVAAVVSAPYWLPYLLDMVRAGSADQLQARFHTEFHSGFDFPFLAATPQGLISAVGLVYVVVAARVDSLAARLAGLMVAAYFFVAIAHFTYLLDTPLLILRASRLVDQLFALAGLLALARVAERARKGSFVVPASVVAVIAAALVLPAAQIAAKPPFLGAQRGATLPEAELAGYDRAVAAAGDAPVVLNGDSWVYSFRPHPGFIAWNPYFSHPAADFEARFEFLEGLDGIDDPVALTYLLAENRYDVIDLMGLSPVEGGANLVVVEERFPLQPRQRVLFVDEAALDPAWFDATEAPPLAWYRPLRTDEAAQRIAECAESDAPTCEVVAASRAHLTDDAQSIVDAWASSARAG